MRILLVKDWSYHRAGRVLTPGDGMGNLLIKRGFAKLAPLIEPEEVKEPSKPKEPVNVVKPKPTKKKNAPTPTTDNPASDRAN